MICNAGSSFGMTEFDIAWTPDTTLILHNSRDEHIDIVKMGM
jgi:hypothetical protein